MTGSRPPEEGDWVHGHAHDPNLLPPEGDGDFVVHTPNGFATTLTVAALRQLPYCEAHGCLIVSTGHGTSGPFTFGGVRLADLLAYLAGQAAGQATPSWEWRQVEAVSADGFGTRLLRAQLADEASILLAYRRDGQPLTRAQGLVRLIVPSEREDALRQVKWIAQIVIV